MMTGRACGQQYRVGALFLDERSRSSARAVAAKADGRRAAAQGNVVCRDIAPVARPVGGDLGGARLIAFTLGALTKGRRLRGLLSLIPIILVIDRLPGEGRGPCHGGTTRAILASHCLRLRRSIWCAKWVPAFAGKTTKCGSRISFSGSYEDGSDSARALRR